MKKNIPNQFFNLFGINGENMTRSKLHKILISTLLLGGAALSAAQTEQAAENIMQMPEGSWMSGVQINQFTIGKATAKHDGRHDRGNVGISQTSINTRFSKGGTVTDPENAFYLAVNRYKLDGKRGEHIEPVAHYLPFVAVGGMYTAESRFRLNYLLGIQFNVNHWDLFTSTRYVAMLAGRSPICCDLGLNYGVYVLTGAKRTQAYPLIGFDYAVGKWSFKAIYPLEISVRHQTLESLMLIATTRWNNDRFRLSESASRRHGFVQYQNYGLELGLEWNFFSSMKLGLAVGENLAARLDTYNRHGKHQSHHTIDSALYGQVNLSYVF